MSLGKLLASGRSLAGGPSVGRYNVSSRNQLPKFGSGKNPFAPAEARPTPESARGTFPAPVDVPASVTAEAAARTPFAPARSDSTRQGFLGTVTARLVSLKPVVVAWIQAGRAAIIKTLAKPMSAGGRLVCRVRRIRRKEPRSLLPRLGKPAVQGELSLDNVRVVRNDLEESDLEIVTAQTDTSTQVAPAVAPPNPHRGPVPPALKKLTNRMLGVKPG
jgi:hypothetical protein